MTTLREYQAAAVHHVLNLRGQWRTALEAPTGSGKTIIMAELLQEPRRQLVLSHRRILLDQLARVLKAHGIRFGYRASGYKPDSDAIVHLAMWQTELRRPPQPGIEIIHADEIHCMRGPANQAVFKRYADAGASLLGYTATPSDLRDLVDNVHRVVGVRELIEQGYLCPPRVYGCGQPEMRLLEKLRRDSSGEYLAGDVTKIVKPQIIFGPVLDHYRELSNGTPFVLFAHSVKASAYWAQSLTGAGVPTAHIDGDDVWVDWQYHKSDSAKRAEVFKRLESGDLAGVSNRFVLREGWDLPCVGHAIICTPVATRKVWVQMCGRVLRPHPGKQYAMIQDHMGSCINHPALDSDEPWDWQSAPGLAEKVRVAEMRNETVQEPLVCPKCKAVRYTGDTCPYCGFHYTKTARYVIQADGKLRLMEGKSFVARQTTYQPGDERIAERLYHAARRSGRTAEQGVAYFAYSNGWRWLPRNLPYMPKYQGDWLIPWRDIPRDRLIPPVGGWKTPT